MSLKNVSLFVMLMLLVAMTVQAQNDKFGAVDTIYIEPYKIDAMNWGVNVSLFNDEEITAISLPMTFRAGTAKLVADSTIFKGGRVENFRVKTARPDTAEQCVTIGLINDIGVTVPPIPPGKGRIATVFISTIDDKEITEPFMIDTTTTPPANSLQMVNMKEGEISEVIPHLMIKGTPQASRQKVEKKEMKEEMKEAMPVEEMPMEGMKEKKMEKEEMPMEEAPDEPKPEIEEEEEG
jgi:hypothetical protein